MEACHGDALTSLSLASGTGENGVLPEVRTERQAEGNILLIIDIWLSFNNLSPFHWKILTLDTGDDADGASEGGAFGDQAGGERGE